MASKCFVIYDSSLHKIIIYVVIPAVDGCTMHDELFEQLDDKFMREFGSRTKQTTRGISECLILSLLSLDIATAKKEERRSECDDTQWLY